jgi:4-hydroxy 2-oxovalerate aldolase
MSDLEAVRLLDSTLRDGSHAVGHRWTPAQVETIAGGLDRAGVHAVGVGHGDGLGASSIQYLRALHPDEELLRTARRVLEHASLAVTFQPGIGTRRHLEQAAELGADLARIATHCTEADIASQHIAAARELGMDVHGDLMMPHMTTPAKLAEQARIMVDAGAHGVHLMDSAGALTPDDVKARVVAFCDAFDGDAAVGIHAHENLSLAVANTLVAVREGATLADACLAGAGAGAGNCQTEALVAALDRIGRPTGIDLFALQDLAEEHVRPALPRQPVVDRITLTQGYAGVPGSFLLHAQRVAERFGVDPRDLMVEVGRLQAVAGQEDLLIEIAARRAAAGRSPSAG